MVFSDPSRLRDLSTSDLFDIYTRSLTDIIDQLLPVRPAKLRLHPLSPWFDGECHSLRRPARRLERVFRRSCSPDDRIAWIRFVRSMHRRYRVIEGEYWERLITSSAGDTRRLWSTSKDLLGGPRSSSSQTAPFTAEDFADYYESKISSIRQHTAQSHPPAISYSTATHLFVKEFYRLRRSAPSSCRSSSSRG